MRRTERLDAPRVWLPRGGRRGWVRATCVGALVVTAAAILLLSRADAARRADPGAPAVPGRSTSVAPPAGGSSTEAAAPADDRAAGTPSAAGTAGDGCRVGEVAPPPGAVGFPLRLPDPAVLAVVHAGQRVDVLVRSDGGTADVVAADLAVLCSVGTAGEPDGVLYLAVSPAQAAALAAIGPGARFSVTVRSPS